MTSNIHGFLHAQAFLIPSELMVRGFCLHWWLLSSGHHGHHGFERRRQNDAWNSHSAGTWGCWPMGNNTFHPAQFLNVHHMLQCKMLRNKVLTVWDCWENREESFKALFKIMKKIVSPSFHLLLFTANRIQPSFFTDLLGADRGMWFGSSSVCARKASIPAKLRSLSKDKI